MGSVQCSTKRPLKAPSPAAMRPSSLTCGKPSGAWPLLIMFTDPGARDYWRDPIRRHGGREHLLCRPGAGQSRGPERRGLSASMQIGTAASSRAHVYSGLAWTTSPICWWAIERSETASALLQLPFYHPMFEEGLKKV